jgi:hypothetical protein
MTVKGKNFGDPSPGRKASNERIIEVLQATDGSVAKTAKILGYASGTLRTLLSRDPELKAAREEIRERALDKAEAKLQEHIHDKESLQALLEYLKSIGRIRGYGNGPLEINMTGKVSHTADEDVIDVLVSKFEKKFINYKLKGEDEE